MTKVFIIGEKNIIGDENIIMVAFCI